MKRKSFKILDKTAEKECKGIQTEGDLPTALEEILDRDRYIHIPEEAFGQLIYPNKDLRGGMYVSRERIKAEGAIRELLHEVTSFGDLENDDYFRHIDWKTAHKMVCTLGGKMPTAAEYFKIVNHLHDRECHRTASTYEKRLLYDLTKSKGEWLDSIVKTDTCSQTGHPMHILYTKIKLEKNTDQMVGGTWNIIEPLKGKHDFGKLDISGFSGLPEILVDEDKPYKWINIQEKLCGIYRNWIDSHKPEVFALEKIPHHWNQEGVRLCYFAKDYETLCEKYNVK